MITVTFPFHPHPKGRPRFSKSGHAYTDEKTRRYEADLKLWASKYFKKPLSGPIEIEVTFYLRPPKKQTMKYPVKTPDWDNLAKSLTDSLNGIAWDDDCQIIESKVNKYFDLTGAKGKTVLTVEELE